MKIKEVLLKEFDDGGFNPMGDVTTGMPSASPTAVAAPAPAQAGQAKWPTTKAEIIAFQKANKLKPDGLIGNKTMAALQKSGATPPPGFKPVGPKAAKAPAAKPAANPQQAQIDAQNALNQQAVNQQRQNDASGTNQSSGMTAQDRFPAQARTDAETPTTTSTTVQGPAATGQDAPSAELDRLKQLAIGGNKPPTPPQANTPTTPPPNTNPLGVTAQAGNVFGQPAPTPDKPNTQTGQAAQPDNKDGMDVPHSGVPASPANNQNIKPQELEPVKTGTGGTLKSGDGSPVMSGSQTKLPDGTIVSTYDIKNGQKFKDKAGKDYVAQVNPMNKQVSFQRSFDSLGGWWDSMTGKKPPPADTMPNANQNASSSYGGPAKEDIEALRRLSGLR